MEATNLIVNGDASFNGNVYGIKFTDSNWSTNVKTSASNNYYKIGSINLGSAKEYVSFMLIDVQNTGTSVGQGLYGNALVRFAINKDVGIQSSVLIKSRSLTRDNFKIHILKTGSIYDFYLFINATNVAALFASVAESSVNSLGVVDNAVSIQESTDENWVGLPSGTLSETIYEGLTEIATKLEIPRKISLTGAVTGNVNFDGTKDVSIVTSVNHTHSYLPLTGGTLTGDINIKKGTTNMAPIRTYEGDANGGALVIEYGGATYIGSGEAGSSLKSALGIGNASETLIIGSDTTIRIFTNCQTIANRKEVSIDTAGKVTADGGFKGALDGNASSATKLATARNIQTNLGSSSAASFNGTTNATPGVTGTLPVGHGGTGNTTGTATYLSANAMPANADFNSYTTPGFYYCGANATVGTMSNKPTGNAFFMIVGKHAGTSQTVFEYMASGFKIYHRNYYNGTWGSWVRIYTTIDKPTASEVGAAAASHTHSYTNTAVKGNAESSYRTGNVNLTPANLGALPTSGGTLTGALVAQANTSYTTAQVRNITMSTAAPSGGVNGQIHFQYT